MSSALLYWDTYTGPLGVVDGLRIWVDELRCGIVVFGDGDFGGQLQRPHSKILLATATHARLVDNVHLVLLLDEKRGPALAVVGGIEPSL
jgi:hypothetical protein